MKAFATGLVVGKFAPLHRGHQFLLDEADRACDRLVILSYTNPELPGCAPARRERWLRRLYPCATVLVLDDARLAEWCDANDTPRVRLPANDAADDVHRRFVGWVLQAMLDVRVEAVFTSEAYGEGFARVLDSLQNAAPPVVHVELDRARVRVPVSGTQVRADVHAHRHLLDPRVYADFVERIALLGGESTGKTTLAQAVATRLQTAWVPEYGRELWEARDGRLEYPDMLHIARMQLEHEEAAACHANRYLICDTTPLTTLLYSTVMFGEAHQDLVQLSYRDYDHWFLCLPDFGFVQDGTRRDALFQTEQQRWYEQQLAGRAINYREVKGSVEERVTHVLEAIGVAL